jgi:hypothetical protein
MSWDIDQDAHAYAVNSSHGHRLTTTRTVNAPQNSIEKRWSA